jgi:DNA replication protein DnaC
MDLQTGNELLRKKRQQTQHPKQPKRISVERSQEALGSDAAYILARINGEPLPEDHPRHTIEWGPPPFKRFNSDRHPALQKAVLTIKKWLREDYQDGGALLISGRTGSGKTHICLDLKRYVPFAVYVNEIDLVHRIQGSYKGKGQSEDELLDRLHQARFLILDDLGAYGTENLAWIQNIYYRLLNGRKETGNATVVATNLAVGNENFSPLRARVGDRVFSRLLGTVGDPEYYVNLFEVGDYRMRGW